MSNPQRFGVGSSQMNMWSAQQVMQQQQQQQLAAQQSVSRQRQLQQMQAQQAQQLQLRQQQLLLQQQQQQQQAASQMGQVAPVGNRMQTPQRPVMPITQQQSVQRQPAQPNQVQPQRQQQQPQQSKEFNTVSLGRFGQETVQDIVSRTQEVFQTLKLLQLPNGTTQSAIIAEEKQKKIVDQIGPVKLLFKRLRLIYDKCNENCQGMEYTDVESLIPLKEEWEIKSDEKKYSEAYKLACEEKQHLEELVAVRNRQLKEIIDHMRRIIAEINTMHSMRRS